MTPYYADDLVTIYHADCLDWMPEADVVVTDPPYGAHKAAWDVGLPLDALALAAERSRAMAVMPGIANLGVMPQALGPQTYRWALSAYITNGMTRGAIGFGNWIACLLYASDGVSLYRQDQDARAFAIGTENRVNHPSPKPLRVMTWILERLPPGTVLDPFMGSGTTLLAAKALGRPAIGVEIDETYCELAATRCSQEVLGLTA